MATRPSFAARYPLLLYFAIAFTVSWGGIIAIVGPSGIPAAPGQADGLFPYVYLAMLAGPIAAGILMTALVHGRDGLRDVRRRLLLWRVGARWYVAALLTAPLLVGVTLFTLSMTSPAFVPGILTAEDKTSVLLFGLVIGLGAGVFEELGWTGFATPIALRRYGATASGLLIGLLWGLWHFLAVWWGSGTTSGLAPAVFLPVALFSFLPPYRVLMLHVYEHTGSLCVGMLMHASLTGSMIILGPMTMSGLPLLAYDLVFAALLWAAVGVAALMGARTAPPVRIGSAVTR